MSSDNGYWSETKSLMWKVLIVWFVFAFLVHAFVKVLNTIVIFGFPLGFWMAAQGSLIAFVVTIFWYARRQNAIDEKYGVAEED